MQIDYRQLRAALTVADQFSFGRAAERLSISEPGLSAQIQRPEKDLGIRLVKRSTRRMALKRLAQTEITGQLATGQLELATLMGATVTRGACPRTVQRMSTKP